MHTAFQTIPMQHLNLPGDPPNPDWLWHGYVARMYATLLVSDGKIGKTTLLNGLLQRFADGKPFLGRAVKPAKVLFVSEDPIGIWQSRRRLLPVEANVELLARPFERHPEHWQWSELCRYLFSRVTCEGFQLVVFDSLTAFLPYDDLIMFQEKAKQSIAPLIYLPNTGVGLLALVNTRSTHKTIKWLIEKPLEPTNPFRFGFRLQRYGEFGSNPNWRRLVTRSHHIASPDSLSFGWDPATGDFQAVDDPVGRRRSIHRTIIVKILKKNPHSLTVETILNHWPKGKPPLRKHIDEFLHRAVYQKRIRGEGKGVKSDPYRYLLANPDDDCWHDFEKPDLIIANSLKPMQPMIRSAINESPVAISS